MSDPTNEDLESEFRRFDTDGNGVIDEDEFAKLLVALGVKFDDGQTHTAFMAIDVNGNRRIEFGEFRQWWTRQPRR